MKLGWSVWPKLVIFIIYIYIYKSFLKICRVEVQVGECQLEEGMEEYHRPRKQQTYLHLWILFLCRGRSLLPKASMTMILLL